MSLNKFRSCKPQVKVGKIDDEDNKNHQHQLRRTFCTWVIQDILNSDKVEFLFGIFPSRTINPQDRQCASTSVKDRLTAMLSICTDVTTVPLVIIGKSKRSRSFPCQ